MKRPLAFVWMLVLCVFFGASAQADPVETVQGFLNEFVAQENEAAYARLGAEVQVALSRGNFDTLYGQLTVLGGAYVETSEIALEDVDKGVAYTAVLSFARMDVLAAMILDENEMIVAINFAPIQGGGPESAVEEGILEEEVGFGAEWVLPGTLARPAELGEEKLPAVVFVHGSGPNDRDETLGNIKPFRDLAQGLAKAGIVSLRYDKRTLVYGEELVARGLEEFTLWEETIEDAILAAEYLRQLDYVDPERVYLVGHSLGAMAGPRIHAQGGDFAGLVLIAGSPRPLWQISEDQNYQVIQAMSPEEQALYNPLIEAEHLKGEALITMTREQALEAEPVFGLAALYQWDLVHHDTLSYAKEAGVPILILQGEEDQQVYAEVDYALWMAGLTDTEDIQFILYPDMGHMMMSDSANETTVQPQLIQDVAAFILAD